jgi:hypothetical protein
LLVAINKGVGVGGIGLLASAVSERICKPVQCWLVVLTVLDSFEPLEKPSSFPPGQTQPHLLFVLVNVSLYRREAKSSALGDFLKLSEQIHPFPPP